MKRALITGWAGFIGRHFRQRLEDDGWTVDGCDIKEGLDCRVLFPLADRQYDLVVHAAAIVGGRMTIDGEPLKVATDVAIDSDMFNWATRTEQGRVLYFSSSAAYPVALQGEGPHPEIKHQLQETFVNMPPNPAFGMGMPDQSYGWVKLTGEYLAHLARAEGLNVTVVRPFSGYGNDQDLTYPFPSFIERAKARRDPFTIWGDGTQVRDFIHVDDVVEACLRLVDSETRLPVNLGTGRATSFNDLATLVTRAAGYSPWFVHELGKPRGVLHRVADVTRMSSFYTPKVSLEDGIRRALRA